MVVWRYMAVGLLLAALSGCAASTKVRSNSANITDKTYSNLLSLSLMGTLEGDHEGEGFHAACSQSLTEYYQQHAVPGAVVALNDLSVNPGRAIDEAVEQSNAQAVLVVIPTGVEYGYDSPDYRSVLVEASLVLPKQEERVWRAQITLHPNTGIYWSGDKNETCNRLVTDIFNQLQTDGFRFAPDTTPRRNTT